MAKDTWQQAKKQLPCRRCGELMTVGIRTQNRPRHVDCGVLDAADQMRQMRNKSGPHYQRWLAGMANYSERRRGGTPSAAPQAPPPSES